MIDNWLSDRKIEFEFFFIFYLSTFYTEIDELLEEKFRRERCRIDAIAFDTSNFENFFDFLSFRFTFTFTIFNARLDQTAIFEDVFDTIQLFMRRKF